MEKNKKIIMAAAAVILAVAVIAAAVSLSQPAAGEDKEITVFAAASLTAAFTELGKKYEDANPGTKVTFSFAGSQTLKDQILNGADVDVFASADWANMDGVSDANLMDDSSIQTFAKNKVVVIVPASNPGNIQTLADLADPDVDVVIGVSTVPIGNYTRTILTQLTEAGGVYAGFYDAVMANVVSEELNVKDIVTKISLGEADAGFVYITDASAAGSSVATLDVIEDQYNVIATYPIGVLEESRLPDEASGFVAFVLSAEGQNILASYGFVKAV